MTDELAWLDATRLAELVHSHELSAAEVVDSAIKRAESVAGELGFVAEPIYDVARERAAQVDLADQFPGVPMVLKDHLATHAGVRHTSGSRFLRDHVAQQDSDLVARYKHGGLIPIATTTASEFALLSTGESQLHGPCRNPWDTKLIAGGSSGGSAVAVAAGVVPVAHGNDAGGSIRIPAGACGLFGLKPTRARNPLGPAYGDIAGGLWVEHVLTRSVRDSAAVLDLTAHPGVGDPYAAPCRAGHDTYLAAVQRQPGRLRIGFTADAPPGVTVAEECLAAMADAASLCESLDHHVEEIALPIDLAAFDRAFAILYAAGAAWTLDSWTQRLAVTPGPDDLEPYTRALADLGRSYSAADYLLAVEEVQRHARALAALHQTYDLVLSPTTATPPPPLRAFAPSDADPLGPLHVDAAYAAYTWIANATGQPAMSVPLFWTRSNLPVGVHFQAAVGREDILLRLAGQLEQARPWAHRRPPHAAR